MASALFGRNVKLTMTVRIRMPQMDAWQARVVRNWLGPYGANWIVQHGPRQLTRHAYPGQPAKRTTAPVRPCSCAYYRATNRHSHVETLSRSLIPTYNLPGISWFDINPRCPHHGDAARFCCPHHQ